MKRYTCFATITIVYRMFPGIRFQFKRMVKRRKACDMGVCCSKELGEDAECLGNTQRLSLLLVSSVWSKSGVSHAALFIKAHLSLPFS